MNQGLSWWDDQQIHILEEPILLASNEPFLLSEIVVYLSKSLGK
jgi:hypothetical protein